MTASTEKKNDYNIFDPRVRGLSRREIEKLGQRLEEFWTRYAQSFISTTRDSSLYALDYLSGLLPMA